ncbi:MAG: hypothetical protein ACRDPJ_08940 [Nocardioidaceae bacterium]
MNKMRFATKVVAGGLATAALLFGSLGGGTVQAKDSGWPMLQGDNVVSAKDSGWPMLKDSGWPM